MKKKCKVVMLPTEKASRLYKAPWDEPPFIGYFNNPQKTIKGDTIAQHLYLISDDEIKVGDWCIESLNNTLFQVEEIEANVKVHKNAMDFRTPKITTDHLVSNIKEIAVRREDCKKVIASTDSELVIGLKGAGRVKIPSLVMPTFSEDFIKAYVKANGGIDEVNVEYDSQYIGKYTTDGIAWLPKLRDDNTVIISEAKTMYSRDEVAQLIRKYRTYAWKKGLTVNEFDKWIEENL
jgi:hypothetical protein